MLIDTKALSSFEKNIEKAINALQVNDYAVAQEYIKYAMLENYHSPKVHNLFGVLVELTGNLSLAGKHYRAALALDPTYRPANRNLERITSFYCRFRNTNPDFGDKPEEEEIIPYIVEYDKNNIGHVKKEEQVRGVVSNRK